MPLHLLLAGALLSIAAFAAQAATLPVGPGKPYAKPCAAIAAAARGDIIEIDAAGDYSGDVCAWATDGLTLRGIGGRARIDAAGRNAQGKGTWVIGGNDTLVENIEFSGATVPDHNGAGIRHQGGNLTVRNCYFRDNENGILAGDAPGSTAQASALLLPTSLGDVSAAINGVAAPLFYASPSQLNVQAPFDVLPPLLGPAIPVLLVNIAGVSSWALPLPVQPTAPAVFLIGNRAAALNQDLSLNGEKNPATAGSVIAVFLTGQGQVAPAVQTGAPASASALSLVTAPFSATIGGQKAEVLFLGLAPGFAGLAQANIRVPALAAGDYPLVITIGGVASNAALIAVSTARDATPVAAPASRLMPLNFRVIVSPTRPGTAPSRGTANTRSRFSRGSDSCDQSRDRSEPPGLRLARGSGSCLQQSGSVQRAARLACGAVTGARNSHGACLLWSAGIFPAPGPASRR